MDGHTYLTKSDTLAAAIKEFSSKFGEKPTHASSAPGRVNLIGEHTDYNDGFVFPMALPMVTVVVGKQRDDGVCKVLTTAHDVEQPLLVEFPSPAGSGPELKPGSPFWANYIKGVVAHFTGKVPGFNAVVHSSVPVGGGVSSSAALEVAMYTFLEALNDTKTASNDLDKILACQAAEHTFAGMPCGIMDQFVSVQAKEGHALLIDCRDMSGKNVPLVDQSTKVVIINSNVKHNLGSSEYPLRRAQCEKAAEILQKKKLRDATLDELQACSLKMDKVVFDRAYHVISENDRCTKAAKALEQDDYNTFGILMNESHASLRDQYQVSCKELDELVKLAQEVKGVYGSRMTGGGFGGCTVSLVHENAVQELVQHVAKHYSGNATCYVVEPSEGAQILQI